MSDLDNLLQNGKAVLQLFLHRRRKILFSIALQRILEQLSPLNDHVSFCETSLDDATAPECWVCLEKEKLFEEIVTKPMQEQLEKNVKKDCNTDGEANAVAPPARVWKVVENWFDVGAKDEDEAESKRPDIINESQKSSDETSSLIALFCKSLQKWEGHETNLAFPSALEHQLKAGLFGFFLKIDLSKDELQKRAPLRRIFKDPKEDKSCWVVIEVCRKCLNHISFMQSRKLNSDNKIHCAALLINHICSLFATNELPQTETKAIPDPRESPKETVPFNMGSKCIKITVVRNKVQSKDGRLQPNCPSAATSKPTSYIDSPVYMNSSCSSSVATAQKYPVLLHSAANSHVPTVLSPSTFLNFPKQQAWKQEVKLANLRVLKVINKTTQNGIKVPQTLSTVKISNKISQPVLVHSGGFSMQSAKLKLMMAKPLATLCPNSVVSKGKVLRIFPRVNYAKRLLSVNRSFKLPSKDKKNIIIPRRETPSVEAAKQSQSSKRKKTGNGGPRKRRKKENAKTSSCTASLDASPEDSKTRSTPRKLKNDSDEATLNRNFKAKVVISGCKPQMRPKTPSKKKAIEKQQIDAVPMKTIIHNYFASSAETTTNGNSTSSLNTGRRSRSKRRSVKKLIPIPYEAHYLCINETLAKKGWKAYWYQKCRCAKAEKKKSEETTKQSKYSEDKLSKSSSVKKARSSQKQSPASSDNENNIDSITTETNSKTEEVTICPVNSTNCNNNSSKSDEESTNDSSASKQPSQVKTVSRSDQHCSLSVVEVKHASGAQTGLLPECSNAKSAVSEFSDKESGESEEICPTPTPKNAYLNIVGSFKLRTLTAEDVETTLAQIDESLFASVEENKLLSSQQTSKNVVDSFEVVKNKAKYESDSASVRNSSIPDPHSVEQSPTSLDSESEELKFRRRKVDAVLQSIMEEKTKNVSCEAILDRVSRSHVFAQCFEEVDKQPGCLDLISVKPAVLQDSPDICKRAENVIKQRNATKASLLTSSQNVVDPLAKQCKGNDLECIWGFGKSNNFFNENHPTIHHVKTNKTKLQHLPSKKPSSSAKAHLTLKRTLMKFSSSKTSNCKIYRHHSRRPKANIPAFPLKKAEEPEEEETEIGIQPYLLPWDIPRRSRSAVVGKLEDLWGDEESSGFVGLNAAIFALYNGVVLTQDRVNHALTALRESSDIFTFSSKPKDGKNTVLLISRKMIGNPEVPEINSTSRLNGSIPFGLNGSIPSSQMNPCVRSRSVSSDLGTSKILLKLRKTGEIFGSAIYSVPDSNKPSSQSGVVAPEKINTVNENSKGSSGSILISHQSKCTRNRETTLKCVENVNKNGVTNQFVKNIDVCESGTALLPQVHAEANSSCNGGSSDQELRSSSKCDVSDHKLPLYASTFSTPLKSAQNSLESDFEPSEFDFDLNETNDIMHSTMVDGSPKSYQFLPSGPSLLKSLRLSDFAKSDYCVFKNEENDFKVVNWDGRVDGKDVLEELLLSINEDSIDTLEQILVVENNAAISPDELLQILKSKHLVFSQVAVEKSRDEKQASCAGSTSRADEYYSFENDTNFYDQSSPSQYRFKETFSSFDSPEVVRGNSRSKSAENSTCAALSASQEELSDSFSSENGNQDNSRMMNGQKDVDEENVDSNSVVKSCNVLLEPLEGMLHDLRRNGSKDKEGETSNECSSKICFTESSARELNRLLKNRALNGAYWRPIDTDSISSASSSPSRFCFRDRRKRKAEEDLDVEMELEVEEEDEDDFTEEEEEEIVPVIRYPKRKNLGSVVHSCPLDSDLHQVLGEIYKDTSGSSVIENVEGCGNAKGKAFQDLLRSEVDLDLVRKWIIESSLPHPPPLRFPVFFARRAVPIKKAPSKGARHIDDSVGANRKEEIVEKPPPKKLKKDTSKTSTKSYQSQKFQNLRRHLFHLRHPNYKGDLSDDVDPQLNIDTPTFLPSLNLVRVDAEEANKKDNPYLSVDILLDQAKAVSMDTVKERKSPKTVEKSRKTVEEMADVPTCSSSQISMTKVPQVSIQSIFSISSRGRAIKPSLRSRTLSYEPPKPKKPRKSSQVKPIPEPELEPPQAEEEPYYMPVKSRGRFVNKHSTCGSYIKKVLESGLYNS